MPVYNYKAIDNTGKEKKDSINAETLAAAKMKLRSMGVMLLEISEGKSSSSKTSSISIGGKKISVTDLSLMTRQLATLLKARIPLVQALDALIDQTDHEYLKVVLSEIKQRVNEGSSLAKVLGDYPKIFNNIYVNMVEAGESSGTLHLVLLKLADFTESQVKLKNKIKGAMTYPLIMVVFGFMMMNILFIFVIPKITKIFVSMKREVPTMTKITIWISDFMRSYWWALFLGIFLGVLFFKKYIKSKSGKSNWDRLVLILPVVKDLVMMINVSRFCSTLATLLTSGVPILASMKIVSNLISNTHMQNAINESRESISEGASMVGPLIKSKLFPPMVTHMIQLGEKSGELEDLLNIVSENYEDQVNSQLTGLTSLLEPLMIIALGLAVAFIVFSIIMPIMELNSIH